VSLFGGVGTIGGALLGAILIATVSNGMNVVGVESYWQPLVIGVIILVGVIIDTHRRHLSVADLFRRRRGVPIEPTTEAVATASPIPPR
jgi:ribose transport system permease protein